MKSRRGPGRRLSHPELMELCVGPSWRGPSAFDNDDDRRHAWEQNRERVRASINAGTTPWAQSWYDEGGEHREPEIIDLDELCK